MAAGINMRSPPEAVAMTVGERSVEGAGAIRANVIILTAGG